MRKWSVSYRSMRKETGKEGLWKIQVYSNITVYSNVGFFSFKSIDLTKWNHVFYILYFLLLFYLKMKGYLKIKRDLKLYHIF